ncbi:MAG: RdgB/HAM1 family non-canonical purine NTP pyrophosphatase [Flavobacteriales bacterium]|nr:RdgB/HAM1 family non-canonical purine NTP pyrophosphatase [Flavobacteriales bacterium]
MDILFASNNSHKVDEVRAKLAPRFNVRSLRDMVGDVDIPETGSTLKENAAIKARYLFELTGMDCFADDTGLEITALNGEPGVYSARYAGEGSSFDDNMDKVLRNLAGHTDRSARFRTVICLIYQGKEYFFDGEVNGELLTERVGGKGFGYDPVFRPEGFHETFAQMSLDQKNTISHRGIAVQRLVDFLVSC